jgi:TetR/AcrR family transcriptional regulator, regulator of cefoperazone and chloramphenicol sensitivity
MKQETEYSGTKRALIEAAGELFAEHGFEGTSIRGIAERVGANLAAINYHFGSKENLYTEVLRYVLTRVDINPRTWLEDPSHFATPARMAETVAQIVRQRFDAYLSPDQPSWWGRVVIRSMLDPTPSLQQVVREVWLPEHAAEKRLFQKYRPEMSEEEAQLWAFSLTGQIAIYVFSEIPILMLIGKAGYDRDFLAHAADHVTRIMLDALKLPYPEGLSS